MPRLLVIDHEQVTHEFCWQLSRNTNIALVSATSAAEGLASFERQRPDVVLLDVGLPDLNGLETFRRLHEIDAKVPVIFLTGESTTASAIEAMAMGAYEYLLKPVALETLSRLVARALEDSRLMRVPTEGTLAQADVDAPDALVGCCPGMHAVYKSIGRVAPQDVTVLILGESGTGKELVARAIYQFSRRAGQPFLAINCAAIPEPLLESELFGHEKGAFTGANQKRIGKFEQCSGGTLFLDEVGDMTPLTQTKMLRVLQGQEFERVGGNDNVKTNVRVIAATNRDLEQLVAAGQFRQDLFYRLSVYTIWLPPLRERQQDLPLLVNHFVSRFSRELGKRVEGVVPEAMEILRRHAWPGNIRELQSVIKRALLETTGPVIVPGCWTAALRMESVPRRPVSAEHASAANDLDDIVDERLRAGSKNLYAECLAATEQRIFSRVLRHTRGNLSQSAQILGIHRATLRTKLGVLGIAREANALPGALQSATAS
jgi:DNA-binding NtrC family response regulator